MYEDILSYVTAIQPNYLPILSLTYHLQTNNIYDDIKHYAPIFTFWNFQKTPTVLRDQYEDYL